MKYPNQVIKKGSTNAVAVQAIKVQLNRVMKVQLQTYSAEFGDTTESIVKDFQKSHNLLQDGAVGELTWERLFTPVNVTIASTILRVRALEIMKTQLYVREATNHNDGIDVEKYLKSVGLGKGYAWCMAAVYWSFAEAAKALSVVNPVPKTAGVLDCYTKASKYRVITIPQAGDQFIMDFGKGTGHTGIVSQFKGSSVYTCEGNTAADPSYAGEDREGNGMYERNRSITSIKAFLRYN